MRNPFGVLFERRNAIASAHELAEYLLSGWRGNASGQPVTETTALNVAAVWTGLAIRSRLLSTLPVDVVEIVDARTRKQRPNHPIARTLARPNAWQTRAEWIAVLEVHRLLRGNAYSWLNRVFDADETAGVRRSRVHEMVPLHPDRMEVIDPDNEVHGGPSRYRYTTMRGQILNFDSTEVLHLKNLSTNGRKGRSFLRDMAETIGGALATQEHAHSLWSRDATPSVALKHPKALSEPARKRLEDSWAETYGRSKEKKRVAVLEEGMELQQLSLTPEDGQFLQTQQDLRAQIAAALMVPPHLMGLSEKSTSWGTGIEQQQIGLQVITLAPDAVIWEQRLNRDLIEVPEKYQVKFNVRGIARGDLRSQFEAFWRGIQMGVYSPNDVRALLDLNPIPDGDVYLQPTNMMPLGTLIDPNASTGANA